MTTKKKSVSKLKSARSVKEILEMAEKKQRVPLKDILNDGVKKTELSKQAQFMMDVRMYEFKQGETSLTKWEVFAFGFSIKDILNGKTPLTASKKKLEKTEV